MKPAILVLAALSSLPAHADEWMREDTLRQEVVIAFSAIDWLQTRSAAKAGWVGKKETNPFLGERPSVRKVDAWCWGTTLANTLVAYKLPRDWREGWQYVSIGVEFHSIETNQRLGVVIRLQ